MGKRAAKRGAVKKSMVEAKPRTASTRVVWLLPAEERVGWGKLSTLQRKAVRAAVKRMMKLVHAAPGECELAAAVWQTVKDAPAPEAALRYLGRDEPMAVLTKLAAGLSARVGQANYFVLTQEDAAAVIETALGERPGSRQCGRYLGYLVDDGVLEVHRKGFPHRDPKQRRGSTWWYRGDMSA